MLPRRIVDCAWALWRFGTGRSYDTVATSVTLAANSTLKSLLVKDRIVYVRAPSFHAKHIIGWGAKRSGRRVLELKGNAEDYHILEDGFLRSVGRRDDGLAFVFDKDGIYYDAQSDSRLFGLIRKPLERDKDVRAQAISDLWRQWRVSKYNDAGEHTGALSDQFVLVVDQVRNDLSISYGLASEETFHKMLDAALEENPDSTIIVKIHPDSLNDPSKRHFDIEQLSRDPRIRVMAEPCHIVDLIEQAEAVYTATSQVGFEALIWGKRVRCFGMPFYAGWGLTEDHLPRPENRESASLEQLVYAALVEYPRYWHPVLQREACVEEIIRLVGLNRRLRGALPKTIYAMGFSRWKETFLRDFLKGSQVHFAEGFEHVPRDATVLVWGSKLYGECRSDLSVLRVEDGFLRSSGLGANLIRPLSLVIDDLGIYFDSSCPSRLETILASKEFSADDRKIGAALRDKIVSSGINKYNLGGGEWHRPDGKDSVLLVVGQVEGDASIQYGSPEVKTNLELLKRVRHRHPGAYILYKPHPDVVAGLRASGSDKDEGQAFCDEIVINVDSNLLLSQVDEVHTMTSLLGFEALLRGVPVTCHGMPFYAGWGLTNDLITCERRGRRLELDELVYAALVEYPRYFSVRGGMFADPQHILLELAELAKGGPSTRPLRRKMLRRILAFWLKLSGRT